MTVLPYHLERWYPAIAAPLVGTVVLDGRATGAVSTAWNGLGCGQALVILDAPRGRRIARHLPGAARIDRWFILPGTGGSHVLLPADSRRGFESGLALLPAGRRRWRLARRALVLAARCGAVTGLAHLVVAIKGRSRAGAQVSWPELSRAHSFSVHLGVPGPLRKAVVLAADDDGEALAVIKLPLSDAAAEQVLREQRALARVHDLAPERVFAPLVHAAQESAQRPWLVTEALVGERSADELDATHLGFLAALAWRTRGQLAIEKLPAYADASARLRELATEVDREWLEALTGLQRALATRFAGRTVPCTFAHGDFAPWNLVASKGHLRAFDWEFAEERAPALFDLCHFHFQTGTLVRRAEPARLVRELRTLAEGRAASLVRNLDVELADVPALAGLHVLHLATHDEALHRRERPDFPQVEWLRRARMELARHLTTELVAGTVEGGRERAA